MDEVKIEEIQSIEPTLTTYGFDQENYTASNHLIGMADEDQVTVLRKQPIMTWLHLGGLNPDRNFIRLSRAILFQSDPSSDFIALISLGLIYVMIHRTGRFILSFFLSETVSDIVMIGVLAGLAYLFAYPLSLLRVILSAILRMTIKSSKDRLIITSFFFMMYHPSSLTSVAILYPMLFMTFGAFKVNRLDRWSQMTLFQIGIFHRVSLWITILYPWLRKAMAFLIGLIWLGYGLPWINPILVHYHKSLQSFLGFLERLLILRGALSLPVVFGFGTMILMTMRWKQYGPKIRYLMGFLIPLLSLPWAYQVTILSVGQGDAIVLQAPFNQEVILIDTAKASAYGNVRSFLDAQGIYTIDALIITHQDNDHSGNADTILRDYDVMRSVTSSTDLDSSWFHLKMLKTTLPDPDDNQGSLVAMLQLKGIRFLFMADADTLVEADLIKQYPKLKADILKVGHHGSSGSTSDFFLSKIQARLAVISVGFNRYGHPSYATLRRLDQAHTEIMMTQTQGDIQFVFYPFFTGLQTSSLKLKPLTLRF